MGKEEIKNMNKDVWQAQMVASDKIDDLKGAHPEITVVDEVAKNLEELFLLRNPKYRFDKNYQNDFAEFLKGFSVDFGNWFYFAWSNCLVKYLPEDLHFELRTGRNKQLIHADEQKKFYESTIVFLGLSVGSHVAVVTAMTGGAKHMRLADPDNLSGDNLNRIRLGFSAVGTNKAVAVARQIVEINPYADITIYTEGITDENAEKIIKGANVVVEEMDNMYWKIRSREIAKQFGVAVLMGTDNGDGAIVDVERYDVNKNLALLNGFAKGITAEGLKTMKPSDLPKIAGKIAGADLTVPRMLDSVAQVGRTLYSWPQLGTAANMCGSVISMLARRIVVKDKNIKSGRYSVNPDAIFESDYKRKWLSRKIQFIKFVREMMSRG